MDKHFAIKQISKPWTYPDKNSIQRNKKNLYKKHFRVTFFIITTNLSYAKTNWFTDWNNEKLLKVLEILKYIENLKSRNSWSNLNLTFKIITNDPDECTICDLA